MILYFADRQLNILGLASTNLMQGVNISFDNKVEDVDSGVASFEVTLSYTRKNRKIVEQMAKSGNYILKKSGSENEFYTIVETESDTEKQEVTMYAEDAGLDLLNEVVGAFTADKAYPIAYYIDKFAYDSGFVIGLNEIPHLSRKLKWEGEATATERIASVGRQFDHAEISYSFEIDKLRITKKIINIHKKRGHDNDVQLRKGMEVENIIVKQSITDLATALIVSGGTPENSEIPITLKGYQYDDGDFYVQGDRLCSRKALGKWSRYVWKDEPNQILGNVGHIVKTYSYDTLSQKELCNRAISHLKDICDIEVNYEAEIAELPKDVRVGDRVNIIDDDIGLYLNTRILKLETSESEGTKTATLGEYLIRDSGISKKVEELAEQFKNMPPARTSYIHIAYADDAQGNGLTFEPSNKPYIGQYSDFKAESSNTSSRYKWSKIQGENGDSGIILSPTAPPKPATGQMWQTGSGAPIKSWNGNEWVVHQLSVENLKADTLSAISANLGKVRSADITNQSADGVDVFRLNGNRITFFKDDKLDNRELGGVWTIEEVGGEFGTELYGHLFSQLTSGNNFIRVRPSGIYMSANKFFVMGNSSNVLWSGASFNRLADTLTLSDAISNQPNGIILVYSAYDDANKKGGDWWFNTFFIPKAFVATHVGVKYCMNLAGGADMVGFGRKMVGFDDTRIFGDDANGKTFTAGGIQYANNKFVLRYVYGI